MTIKTLEFIHKTLKAELDSCSRISDKRTALRRQAEAEYEAACDSEDQAAIDAARKNLREKETLSRHANYRTSEAQDALEDFEAHEF